MTGAYESWISLSSKLKGMSKFIDGKTTIEGTDELVKELSLTHINHRTKRLKIRIVVGLLSAMTASITGYFTYQKMQAGLQPIQSSTPIHSSKEVPKVTDNKSTRDLALTK